MPSQTIRRIFLIGVPVFFLVYLFAEFRISGDLWKEVVSSDGRGYYHYLINYFIEDSERDFESEQRYLSEVNGHFYTKYPAGPALLMSPFFGFGYLHSVATAEPLNGVSFPFQLWIGIGGVFYLCFGAIGLYLLLRSYRLSKPLSYLTVLLIVFGTNLLLYGVVALTMSHVYSFFAITWLALFIRKSFASLKSKYLIISFLLFGLVFLIRPFNALIVFAIPALLADFEKPFQRLGLLFKKLFPLITGSIILVAFILFQLLLWRNQTGEWLLFSYSNEGFYFMNPQVSKVLFSFNKGLFIYTPLMLFVVLGLIMTKAHRSLRLLLGLFFLLLTYFISSWWCWNYASGFGLRPYIDFYGLFAIPLALFIKRTKGWWRNLLMLGLMSCVVVNLIQSYQYAKQIMQPGSMNFEKYQYIFLRTDDEYINKLGGNFDLPPYAPNGLKLVQHFELIASDSAKVSETFAHELKVSGQQVGNDPHAVHLKISFDKKDITPTDSVLLVFDIQNDTASAYYTAFAINDLPDQPAAEWRSAEHSITLPTPGEGEILKIYLWNRTSATFFLRNYAIHLYVPE